MPNLSDIKKIAVPIALIVVGLNFIGQTLPTTVVKVAGYVAVIGGALILWELR